MCPLQVIHLLVDFSHFFQILHFLRHVKIVHRQQGLQILDIRLVHFHQGLVLPVHRRVIPQLVVEVAVLDTPRLARPRLLVQQLVIATSKSSPSSNGEYARGRRAKIFLRIIESCASCTTCKLRMIVLRSGHIHPSAASRSPFARM